MIQSIFENLGQTIVEVVNLSSISSDPASRRLTYVISYMGIVPNLRDKSLRTGSGKMSLTKAIPLLPKLEAETKEETMSFLGEPRFSLGQFPAILRSQVTPT